jgi:hypothetical protein
MLCLAPLVPPLAGAPELKELEPSWLSPWKPRLRNDHSPRQMTLASPVKVYCKTYYLPRSRLERLHRTARVCFCTTDVQGRAQNSHQGPQPLEQNNTVKLLVMNAPKSSVRRRVFSTSVHGVWFNASCAAAACTPCKHRSSSDPKTKQTL